MSDSNALKAVDKLIEGESDPERLSLFIEQRGIILEQDSKFASKRIERNTWFIYSLFKFAMSPTAIALGSYLALQGNQNLGLFIVGAGLSVFAAEYVTNFIRMIRGA